MTVVDAMDSWCQEEDIDLALKVVIVGDGGVGKSSLIKRFCQGVFTSSYKKTIGVDFLERVVSIDNGEQVRLMIWDTAGQEEFDAITRAYYRGSNFCLLAFSTTDRESFENIPWWKEKVERECGPVPMVLVMNKIDLISNSVIGRYEAEELASSLGLVLYTTSSKENVNIDTVFQHLAERSFKARQTDRAQYDIPSCQVGGWRGIVIQHHQRKPLQQHQQQQRLRLQSQIQKQNQRIQGRREIFSDMRETKPRSVQRKESQAQRNMEIKARMTITNPQILFEEQIDDELDEMWEDPMFSELQSYDTDNFDNEQKNNFSLGHQNLLLDEKGRFLDYHQPRHHSLRIDNTGSQLQDDQEQWHSNLFAASTPSLVHSHKGRSQMRMDSGLSTPGKEDDYATQFLESPMFDSLRWRRGWGVRKKGKYNLYGNSGGLTNNCSIM